MLAFDIEKERFVSLTNKSCKFGYRESIFKESRGKYIIFQVSLRLKKGGQPDISYESLRKYLDEKGIAQTNLKKVRKAVLLIRRQKLEDPRELPNAGSFFKNPVINIREFHDIKEKFPDIPSFESNNMVKLFAGWLIEKAGWKGKRIGKVGVSAKNALVIMWSNSHDSSTIARAKKIGILDFMIKSEWEYRDVVKKVREYLDTK